MSEVIPNWKLYDNRSFARDQRPLNGHKFKETQAWALITQLFGERINQSDLFKKVQATVRLINSQITEGDKIRITRNHKRLKSCLVALVEQHIELFRIYFPIIMFPEESTE